MHFSIKHDSSTIYELTRKQVKTQYRDSSLGFIWTVLNPLLTMLVMWFVFDKIFGGDDPYYPIYLLTGNIMFTAIRNSSVQCLESLVIHRDLLLRTKVELYVFPFSNCVSTLVNFAFSLIALLPFLVVKSITIGAMPPAPLADNMRVLFETVPILFSYQLPFLLLMLPAFFLFELGIGFFLSIIYVFFRDIKHIYSIFLVLWMYMTPIFYKVDLIANRSPTAFTILKLNPMYHFVKYFRECIYGGVTGFDFNAGAFQIKDLANGSQVLNTYLPTWGTLGWCYVCGVAAFIIGFSTFQIFKRKAIVRL